MIVVLFFLPTVLVFALFFKVRSLDIALQTVIAARAPSAAQYAGLSPENPMLLHPGLLSTEPSADEPLAPDDTTPPPTLVDSSVEDASVQEDISEANPSDNFGEAADQQPDYTVGGAGAVSGQLGESQPLESAPAPEPEVSGSGSGSESGSDSESFIGINDHPQTGVYLPSGK